MRLGICTIQRNRGRWITEWCAFHYLVGFRKFYFFAHKCTDDTHDILGRLQSHIDVKVFAVPDDIARPQLASYKAAYESHGNDVDWMAFIDGDEFLFPTRSPDISVPIAELDDGKLGALGVYWSCFGSSGHVAEPEGLILENYRRRAPEDFLSNSHVKSIVRGGLGKHLAVLGNGHLFGTPGGTFDEKQRRIERGLTGYPPSYERMRINHYICQSLEFFKNFKQHSGAPDSDPNYVRPDAWWTNNDRNDVHDSSVENFYGELKSLIRDWGGERSGGRPATFAEFPRPAPADRPDQSRNQPCPCGSGKRFKHCHGALHAPVV
jgi:hypothetical protein